MASPRRGLAALLLVGAVVSIVEGTRGHAHGIGQRSAAAHARLAPARARQTRSHLARLGTAARGGPGGSTTAVSERSLRDDLGTLIVSGYAGASPPRELLARVRAGQIGGVILFGENTAGGLAGTRAAIAELQAAARQAGTYPLLVMTDQEGGEVRRLASLPPWRSARDMGSAPGALAQGLATGRALRELGVNVDLAPVADVESNPQSFLGARSFGSTPGTVARRACAFAAGLREAGVAYTLKHFPGLGAALTSTDVAPVVIHASRAGLRADYGAYRLCGHGPLALVMVSSAGYPSLTGNDAPAVVDGEIYHDELRAAGVEAVTISDALGTPAIAGQRTPALRALDAGLDLLLYVGEGESGYAYPRLLADVDDGALSRARLVAAAAAVGALKGSLAAVSR